MKHFGLLGEHLSHSFSPMIHSMLADYDYRLFEKSVEEIDTFLHSGDFDGLNVTIPYKKTVIPFCQALSPSAERIGSVNTILRRPDGTLYGDNTDDDGFRYLLSTLGIQIAGKKALVLGSGGASLTVQSVLADMGAAHVVTLSRSGPVRYESLRHHYDAQVIVNTTPVGMYPNNGTTLVDLTEFKDCLAVVDIVYNPAKTALLLDAEALQLPHAGGLAMLVAQAKRAAELFTGCIIDNGRIADISAQIERKTKNIVLIGMPGSGKSTTSEALAANLSRPFYDTDVEIVKVAGKSIPQIFSKDGESAFRRMETEALREVSKLSGAVIATGGGIVKTPENKRLLRQNSTVVFLERPLEYLPSDGRPLSQQTGIAALAQERLPLYRDWSDFQVTADGVQETVQKIKGALGL